MFDNSEQADKTFYAFTKLIKKSKKNFVREVGDGKHWSWEPQSTASNVKLEGQAQVVGSKKMLTFTEEKRSKHWTMYEYMCIDWKEGDWVLCKISYNPKRAAVEERDKKRKLGVGYQDETRQTVKDPRLATSFGTDVHHHHHYMQDDMQHSTSLQEPSLMSSHLNKEGGRLWFSDQCAQQHAVETTLQDYPEALSLSHQTWPTSMVMNGSTQTSLLEIPEGLVPDDNVVDDIYYFTSSSVTTTSQNDLQENFDYAAGEYFDLEELMELLSPSSES